MSLRATRIAAFLIGGVLVVELARTYGQVVVPLLSVVTLGVVLTHAQQLQDMVTALETALHPPYSGK